MANFNVILNKKSSSRNSDGKIIAELLNLTFEYCACRVPKMILSKHDFPEPFLPKIPVTLPVSKCI